MSNQKNNQDIRIVRGSDRYAGAPDTDLFIQVPLENTKKSITIKISILPSMLNLLYIALLFDINQF